MNYHNIKHDDMLNGEGLRVTLFVSGCARHCNHCQNPQTWDPNSGIPFDADAMREILDYLSRDYIAGLTLSGGDPLYETNLHTVTTICAMCKLLEPTKTIWLYTGAYWEDVCQLPLMRYIDVIAEGPYQEGMRDTHKPWVGSSNQRVIDVQETIANGGNVVLWEGTT